MSSSTEQVIERIKQLRDRMRYYGLIMGGIFVLFELMQYWQHNNVTVSSAFALLAVKLTVMFLAANLVINKIKPEFFENGMSYAQSFSLIFRLFLYGSLLAGLFAFVLNKWIDPEYLSKVLENSVRSIQSHVNTIQLPAEQLEYVDEFIEQIQEGPIPSPLTAMWNQMWSYLVWGMIVGFVLSFITRDKNIKPLATNQGTE